MSLWFVELFCLWACVIARGGNPPELQKKFDDRGAAAGEQLADVELRTLEGEPTRLSNNLGSLTLLVTSSYTCPKSRSNFPPLVDLAGRYKDRLNVVILYVIEAHPAGDPSPYRDGKEDVTDANRRDGILRRQPTTLKQRVALANEFHDHFNVRFPVVVDLMSNFAWKSVGAGPNMAILLDPEGRVLARQGWFDAAALGPLIEAQIHAGNETSTGQTTELARLTRDRDLYNIIDDAARPYRLGALLDSDPHVIEYVTAYEARGDFGGETLLQAAVRQNRMPAVQLLLDRGADVDRQTTWKPSPLYQAASDGQVAMVKLLLTKTRQIDIRFNGGPTALQIALFNEHRDVAGLLRAAGAVENFYTRVADGQMEAAASALKNDESLAGRPDGAARTPLMYAAVTGQTAMVELLLQHGAPLNPPAGMFGNTSLMWAVRRHHADTVAALLAAGANVDAAHESDGTPLHIAAADGETDLVQALLKAGGTPTVEDELGQTPLHVAAADGKRGSISLLLAAGVNVDIKTGSFSLPCGPGTELAAATPLMLAAENGHVDAVKLLLDHGAQITAVDATGRTALECALQTYTDDPAARATTAKYLIDHGVAINAEDQSGHTALDDAREAKLADTEAILLAAGGKPGSHRASKSSGWILQPGIKLVN